MNETKFARFDFIENYISSTSGIIIIQILGILMFIFALILRQGSATVKRTKIYAELSRVNGMLSEVEASRKK